MSGLDSLREASSALRRWRPAVQWKLRDAREEIERVAGPVRWWTEVRRTGGWPRDFTRASDERPKDGPAVPNPGRSRRGAGPGIATITTPAGRGVRMVVPPSSTRKVETRLRKLERWFPELRWLFRRLDRLALAGKPRLLRARRIFFRHRRMLIWSFVIAISLAMPST